MPRTGTGTYNLPTAAGNPVVSLTPIATSWANPTLQDIANALTMSVSSDGQTAMTGNLNLAANKILNVTSGTANSDGVNFGQVFNSPAFTGTPTAPTQPNGDNSTNLATTAFVKTALTQFQAFYEPIQTVATALPAVQNFDLQTQQILYATGNSANNITINLRGTSTVTLANYLPAGNSITGVVLVTNGTTPYVINAWQIDGMAITPRYLTGAVISQGNASAIDVYNFSLLRAASGGYTLLLSQQYYS